VSYLEAMDGQRDRQTDRVQCVMRPSIARAAKQINIRDRSITNGHSGCLWALTSAVKPKTGLKALVSVVGLIF